MLSIFQVIKNTKKIDAPEAGTPTLNPNFESSNKKDRVDNNININNNNKSNNFIIALTNTISKITEEKNNVINNNTINSNNNINENISINNNIKNNYVQELVLQSSSKKINEKNYSKNKKEKYLNDFEEYEISDSSLHGEEEEYEDDELNSKFIPKWAMDEEYINSQLMKQTNNKNLVYRSFGNFKVEHLNLNMIFETHNDNFDMRNSTADWRGDDSWTKNKVTDINNNDGNDIFPDRQLQFV